MKDRITRAFNRIGLEPGLAYVTLGQVFYTGFGALLWFYLASSLTASTYGLLNYDISVVTIFVAVGIMGFETTLTTYIAKGVYKMTGEAIFLVLLAAVLLSLLIYIIFNSYSLGLLLVGMLIFTLAEAELLGKREFKSYMILIIVQRTMTLFSVPIMLSLYGVEGAILGFAISHIIPSYRFLFSLKQIKFSVSTIRPIRKYFLHSYALGISKVLPYFSDKLLILPLFGAATVGYYQFGVQILIVVSTIPLIFYSYLLPRIAGGDKFSMKKTELLCVVSASISSFLLIISTPIIIRWLFPYFISAIGSTQIILIAGVPLAISAIYNSRFMAVERSSFVITGSLIFLVAQYTGIILLGFSFGLTGLSTAMVVAACIQCLYLYLKKSKSMSSTNN